MIIHSGLLPLSRSESTIRSVFMAFFRRWPDVERICPWRSSLI